MTTIPEVYANKIGPMVRAVARAEADRHFKQEHNTTERTAVVIGIIASSIFLALLDAGIPFEFIYQHVVPSEEIANELRQRGYVMEE